MTEAYPTTVPNTLALSNPADAWQAFAQVATEDPALVMKALSVPVQSLEDNTQKPTAEDAALMDVLYTANRADAEQPTPERMAHVRGIVDYLLDDLLSTKIRTDDVFASHSLYKNRLMILRQKQLASKEDLEGEQAALKQLHEARLALLAFAAAKHAMQQAVANPLSTPKGVPQQRTPDTSQAHLAAA